MLIEEMLGGAQIFAIIVLVITVLFVYKSVAIVSQSEVYVIERIGRYRISLKPGLAFIVPFVDSVAHKVSVLERQLPEFQISVITRDNVDVTLEATVFYRVTDAHRSVYRIRNVGRALHTEAVSIVRSAAGRLELDDLQSSRESMNTEVAVNLQRKADEWGIQITSTAITDVMLDEQTKTSQRQQLNAERERRAQIALAEGTKRAAELTAEAELYAAQRQAEAVRVTADADAYSITVAAEADATRTRMIGKAIEESGPMPINYELIKRQSDAMASLASSNNTKTLIVPNDIAGIIGSVQLILEQIQANGIMRDSQSKDSDSPVSGSW